MPNDESMKPFEYYTIFTRRVMSALDRWFDMLSESVGLSGSELKLLAFLHAGPSSDTAQWAATQLGISKALVSKVVEQLCAKGYLKQVQDRDDRRCYHLIVQDAAKPLLEGINEQFIQSWKIISRDISDEEFKHYLNVMSKMIRNISEGFGFDIPNFSIDTDDKQ